MHYWLPIAPITEAPRVVMRPARLVVVVVGEPARPAEADTASEPLAAPRRMEVCPACGGRHVHPTEWEEVEDMHWQVSLRCPDCEWRDTDVYEPADVERYDDVSNDGTDEFVAELARLARANTGDVADRRHGGLDEDDLTPADF